MIHNSKEINWLGLVSQKGGAGQSRSKHTLYFLKNWIPGKQPSGLWPTEKSNTQEKCCWDEAAEPQTIWNWFRGVWSLLQTKLVFLLFVTWLLGFTLLGKNNEAVCVILLRFTSLSVCIFLHAQSQQDLTINQLLNRNVNSHPVEI